MISLEGKPLENLVTFKKQLDDAGIGYRCGEPLSAHTTFHIGGAAEVFCIPKNQSELCECIRLCKKNIVPCYILGRGSNTLFSDDGYPGAVILIGDDMSDVVVCDQTVYADAGASLTKVCMAALQAGLTGLEFAYGIPGTVGGAIYMNAGAYGGEMKDVLIDVDFLDEQGHFCREASEKLELGYRTSSFMRRECCIVGARFKLMPGDKTQIKAKMDELMQRRRDKQPLEFPSAGSTFKRPQGAFAGALIEQCGLRGFTVGGAAISEKHCGFVVNMGNATCADIVALTKKVHDIVLEKTGFALEREIRVVGEKEG